MNTEEILSCLQQDRFISPCLAGVYPRDKLPTTKTLPSAVIANTDVSAGLGEHWVAIYFPIEGEALYFDIYGLEPQQKEFISYIGSPYDHNDVQLQSPFSSACGQYAIFFTAMACRGCTMKQIQKGFSKNLPENDAVVTEFVNRNYDMRTNAFNYEFLTKQVCYIMKDVKINGKHVCLIHA
jgi:hypothetical protein